MGKRTRRIITFLLIFVLLFSAVIIVTGCKNDEPVEVPKPDLNEIMSEMEKQATLSDMMELIESDLLDIYGIESSDAAQFCGCILGDGISPDEIVMIKAANEDAAQRVRQSLENRLQNKINEAKGYNPDAYALMQKSKVSIKGVYVSMIVSPEQDALVSIYDSFFS